LISFARSVKEEIVYNEFDRCCQKALLAALIKINGSLSISRKGVGITLPSENAKIASKSHKILKNLYQPDIELLVSKKVKLKKNNVYVLKINKAKEILEDLCIDIIDVNKIPEKKLLEKQCCKRAYLAGAFLACGSVNHPNTANYHLEIGLDDQNHTTFICDLMNQFQLNAKIIKRRNKYVAYLKSAEKIGDFLRIVGSYQSLLFFESTRIDRDFTNNINRLENCLVANEMKTLQASNAQINDIVTIQMYGDLTVLDEKIQVIASLRLENPEASLNELVDLYIDKTNLSISKSNINHQLKKIKAHAQHLRNMYEREDGA